MHQIHHRTDNVNESFHASMSRSMPKHPNVYQFLKVMKILTCHENRKDHSKYKQRSAMTEKLEEAWQLLETKNITIEEFLLTKFFKK